MLCNHHRETQKSVLSVTDFCVQNAPFSFLSSQLSLWLKFISMQHWRAKNSDLRCVDSKIWARTICGYFSVDFGKKSDFRSQIFQILIQHSTVKKRHGKRQQYWNLTLLLKWHFIYNVICVAWLSSNSSLVCPCRKPQAEHSSLLFHVPTVHGKLKRGVYQLHQILTSQMTFSRTQHNKQ